MNIEMDMAETLITYYKMAQNFERNLRLRMMSMCAVENSYCICGLTTVKQLIVPYKIKIPFKFAGA